MTWADDDHQYAAWGDGGGFTGTNSEGRVSLGVARIAGGWNDYRGRNTPAPATSLSTVFPTKWISNDGRNATLVFTGRTENDSLNTVRGRFVLHEP